MKKVLLVLALLASPAYGQVLQRNVKACDVASPGVKTLSCSLSKATTAGSMIRVIEIDRTAAGARTVKSAKGGTLAVVTSLKNAGAVTVFYGPSDGSLTYTVTLPSTGVYNPVMWVQEDTFGGTLDGNVSAGGALNTTPQAISAGTLTTTVANDYLINGCEDTFGAGGLVAGAGWNAFLTAPDVPGGFEDRSVSVAGAYLANGTLAQAQYTWNCAAVAFKGGTTPPPPPPPPPNVCSGTGTLQINGSGTPLSMAQTFTMPPGTIGVAYSASIATAASVTGGTPPYTYAITSGALSSGLTMNTVGIISGAPGTVGTFSFVVTVKDSAGSAMDIDFHQKIELARRLQEGQP